MAHRSVPGARRWLASSLLAGALIVSAGPTATRAVASPGPPVDEYEIKAAFLYNFVKFVRWPCDGSADGCGAYRIGVLGDDPFGSMLDEAVVGKRIRGNALEIVRFSSIDEVDGVHVLFVCSGSTDVERVLRRLEDRPVLTVGESERFALQGGTVRLFLEKRRMRFEINPGAAKRHGVHVSPELLVLARIVEEEK